MELGGAKRRGEDVKVITLSGRRKGADGANRKERTSFYGGELTPLYTMKGVRTM